MISPRIARLQKGRGSFGAEAVAWCREHGLELDDWEAFVLEESLRKRGQLWSSYEIGVNVPRQNGKGVILQARELVELYLVGSELTIHSAHLHKTSLAHFRRLWARIENDDDLLAQVKPSKYGRVPAKTTGQEAIELVDGRRIEFSTRTKSASRGLSCDLLVLDEAMFLPEADHAAAFFTGSARPNPQVWYTGSAVDQHVHDGVVFARLRERAIAGEDEDLAWFEWSVEGENPSNLPDEVLRDRAAWEQANPALGIRIRAEHVEKERRAVGAREFAVERLGVGDWPRTDQVSTNPLDYGHWMELADAGGAIREPLVVAFDVSPERKAAVVVAGRRPDGLVQGELVESKSGTAWVAPEVARIVKEHKVTAVCDGRGPASRLVPELRDLGVEAQQLSVTEHSQACGHLMDAIDRRALRHLDDPELNSAVRAASTRPLGDAWAWSRRDSSTNIAPLVAFTLAVSGALTQEKPRKVSYAWA